MWSALYGIAWWILGGQILMPIALGMPPFESITIPAMRIVAMGSLVRHLIYGLILGGLPSVFAGSTQRVAQS